MVTQHRRLGDRGEAMAAEFLQEKGYTIVETNFLVREGEIDLIAREKDELVFIEVKTRTNARFGSAIESITPQKQERLFLAVQQYLLQQNLALDGLWRIDMIAIDLQTRPPSIEHFKNAFAH